MRKLLLTCFIALLGIPSFAQGVLGEPIAEMSRDEAFQQNDPSGWKLALVAIAVVFLSLVLITLIIKIFGKAMVARSVRREVASLGVKTQQQEVNANPATISSNADDIAAIGLALRMFQDDLHIQESTVITINSVSRIYSPWSSKIHGITQVPERRNR
jgi:Na+-transporting methylmalonyl-CoA/oxaloacetate decarboxylase gamma subunit